MQNRKGYLKHVFGAVPCSLWCLEEMAGCFCESAHWFSISESSDKELGHDETHRRGEEGLVGFSHEDVEKSFTSTAVLWCHLLDSRCKAIKISLYL